MTNKETSVVAKGNWMYVQEFVEDVLSQLIDTFAKIGNEYEVMFTVRQLGSSEADCDNSDSSDTRPFGCAD